MRRVLVTGGWGFIGSHLVDRLLGLGLEVVAYDNGSTGRRSDLSAHAGERRLHVVEGDILDPPALEEALAGCDTVWHLGANTIMQGRDRAFDFEQNTYGTWNVLEAMVRCEVSEILFASTAAVYGDEPGKVLGESFGPLRPISFYGASKLAAEALVSAYAHRGGLSAWVFRFSNVVGGGMGHGVIFDFVQKLRANPHELEVWGDGLGQKPYFLVEDCLEGMLCAHRARPEREGPGPVCDTYNLGTGDLTSVDRVAQIVIEELGLSGVKLRHTGGRQGFPGDVPVVNFNADKMLAWGWRARHTSGEAVRLAARRIIHDQR
jgi:UDP-glucose 4-epimerase